MDGWVGGHSSVGIGCGGCWSHDDGGIGERGRRSGGCV